MPAHFPSSLALAHRSRADRWRVIKLGGSTVASVAVVRAACQHIAHVAERKRVAVVVSALAGVTDTLEWCSGGDADTDSMLAALEARHRNHLRALGATADAAMAARLEALQPLIDAELRALGALLALRQRRESRTLDLDSQRDHDVDALAMSMGERLSARIVHALLADAGAVRVDAAALLVARGPEAQARADLEASRRRCAGYLATAPTPIWVVPGFFAYDSGRRLRLLGRDGSDTSATLLGASLDADRVEIWTDVDGVYDRDPRRDASARRFASLGYDQAERLARGGARVLHGHSIEPARRAGVPILVRDARHLERSGTWIGDSAARPATEVAA